MNDSVRKSKRFLVPTVAWGLYVIVYLVLFSVGSPKYHDLARSLTQWDGQHYLSIARDGYEKFPCPYDHSYICGNVGWFPAYPLVARLVGYVIRPLGFDIRTAMVTTSWLALWLALLILYRLVERAMGCQVATVSMAALLLFPTAFYFLTSFPYSLYLLLAVLIFYLLERASYLAVVVPAGLLTVTYPSGVVIGLPILVTLVLKWTGLGRRDRMALLASLVAIVLAFLIYFGYYWAEFGDFLLYHRFQSQSYYAHHLTLPLLPIVDSLRNESNTSPVFIMLVFVTATAALFYNRKAPFTWQLFMFGVLLFTPTFGTTTCYYRHIVVAFPLFSMVGLGAGSSWRRYLLIPYAVTALVLSWTVYLSAYKAGTLM